MEDEDEKIIIMPTLKMNYYLYPPMAMPQTKPNNNLRILQLQPENQVQAPASDPVTKAIMDNIMGKLPTTKAVMCKCHICNLVFSSKNILESHLTGAKHNKKLKSHRIMRGENYAKDEKKKCLRCDTCDIYVNSTQQLQTHLSGSKHLKALKKGTTGVNGSSNEVKTNSNIYNYNIPTTSNYCNNQTPTSTVTKANKVEKEQGDEILPPGIQKIPESAASKSVKYFCNNCSVTLNSLTQLKQHIGSKKHKEREKGAGKVKKVWKKPKPYQQPSPTLHNDPSFIYQYKQPLSCNFVSGGSIF